MRIEGPVLKHRRTTSTMKPWCRTGAILPACLLWSEAPLSAERVRAIRRRFTSCAPQKRERWCPRGLSELQDIFDCTRHSFCIRLHPPFILLYCIAAQTSSKKPEGLPRSPLRIPPDYTGLAGFAKVCILIVPKKDPCCIYGPNRLFAARTLKFMQICRD